MERFGGYFASPKPGKMVAKRVRSGSEGTRFRSIVPEVGEMIGKGRKIRWPEGWAPRSQGRDLDTRRDLGHPAPCPLSVFCTVSSSHLSD